MQNSRMGFFFFYIILIYLYLSQLVTHKGMLGIGAESVSSVFKKFHLTKDT